MKRVFLCLICVAFCISSVSAQELNWFFKPVEDSRPVMPPDGVEDPGKDAIMIGPDEKCVYLTFDAGYVNENVEEITRILIEEEVPAAFFILKQVVRENGELLKTWQEAGFLVCNHTLTHINCARATKEKMNEEILGLEALYRETTGQEMAKFFRPPEGAYNASVIESAAALGYRTVFWSAAYADWDNEKQMAPRSALELLLKRTHSGAVVLLHPTSATNAAILRDYIRALKTAGYRFGSLEEL